MAEFWIFLKLFEFFEILHPDDVMKHAWSGHRRVLENEVNSLKHSKTAEYSRNN